MARSALGTVLPARFPGVCKQCRLPYQAGEQIKKVAFKTWVCAKCAGINGDGHSLQPITPPATNGSNGDQIRQRVEEGWIRSVVRNELEGAELTVDQNEVRETVRDEMTKAGVLKVEIEVKTPKGNHKVEGKTHASFDRVVRLAACQKNILLVGPAGCGKTHLAEQVAQALGLRFAFISCTAGMSEGQLLGRLVPTGEAGRFEYLRSEFVRCYEEGGVFLFDEIDAADSNTLLVLKSALANGSMAIPNRPEKPIAIKHPDFVCIGAANTFGTGADRQYVGRNQLDESTLDRFRIGQIEMDYDAETEAALCPDVELRTRLQVYRQKCRQAKLRRIVSMRFLRDAYQVKQAGLSDADIDNSLFSGWSVDEVAKVKGTW
jgi:MoxR-like ATPase